jgi:uncharacterized protein YndB with AHSA1/START domain
MNVRTAPVPAGGWLLTIVRMVPRPPAAVWGALTDEELQSAWTPVTAVRDRPVEEPDDGVDEPAVVVTEDPAGEEVVEVGLTATVTELDPPWLLAYRWGADLVRWQLAVIPGGTMLVLTHQVTTHPDLARAAAGWHLCLDHLADDPPQQDWHQLHAHYTTRFG